MAHPSSTTIVAPLARARQPTGGGWSLRGRTLVKSRIGLRSWRDGSAHDCHIRVRCPQDDTVAGTSADDGARRKPVDLQGGIEDLKVYAGIKVSVKDVERVAEVIGQDMEV